MLAHTYLCLSPCVLKELVYKSFYITIFHPIPIYKETWERATCFKICPSLSSNFSFDPEAI